MRLSESRFLMFSPNEKNIYKQYYIERKKHLNLFHFSCLNGWFILKLSEVLIVSVIIRKGQTLTILLRLPVSFYAFSHNRKVSILKYLWILVNACNNCATVNKAH